jgi:hypothetical protein
VKSARLTAIFLAVTITASLTALAVLPRPSAPTTSSVALVGTPAASEGVRDDLPPRASRSRLYVAPSPSKSPHVDHPPARKATSSSPRATRSRTSHIPTGVWDRLAQCEASGDWHEHGSNGFYGGLQFTIGTWRSYGGTKFAWRADYATRDEQIAIAKKVLAGQGWGAWPACSRKLGLR